jgi:hypothetical protein
MPDDCNASDTLLIQLTACETRVWNALIAGDQSADAAALHHQFLGVYPDGFAAKSDHADQLANGPTVTKFGLSERRVKPLGRDHALLSYRADFTRVAQNSPETMYVSSIWQRTATGWINIFSQDTPAAI